MRKTLLCKRAMGMALLSPIVWTGFAQTTFTVDKLNYVVNEDGTTATVTGHVDSYSAAGEVNIPEKVQFDEKEYVVTAIGTSAFESHYLLTKLTLPNTLTKIGDAAFQYCQNIEGELVIPNSVTVIGYGSFNCCDHFTKLVIGSSVDTIADHAFDGCIGLTDTLFIPSNVRSIESCSFGYNDLKAIVIDPENKNYDSRLESNAIIETSTNKLLTGCKGTVIPEGIKTIGFCAFRGTNLPAITLPSSLVTIEENAFAFCYEAAGSLTIPDSVTTIGPSAFFECNKLTDTLTLGKSVAYIGDYAFKNCSNFTYAVSRATTPPEIGNEFGYYTAFEKFGCNVLIIPDGTTEAYMASMLHDEYGLCGFNVFIEESNNVPVVFTEFASGKFNYRINRDSVSVTVISHVDGYEAAGEVIIPEKVSYEGKEYAVTAVGEYAFMYNFAFTKLSIPNTVTRIGDGAFGGCGGFTGNLVIPNAVTYIGYAAFSYCTGFEGELQLGNAVDTISDMAFSGCSGLTGKLNIPASVKEIGGSSFSGTQFNAIVIDPANPVYDSRNNCNAIVKTSTNTLILGTTNSTIPEGIVTIGADAFANLYDLPAITLPSTLVTIGKGAFSNCYGAKGDLTIPNSVTTIEEQAFFNCSALDGKLTIGESVNFIGDQAFSACASFTSAVSLATVPPVLEDIMDEVWIFNEFGCTTLTVPAGSAAAYLDSKWYDPNGLYGFKEFVEVGQGDGLEEITAGDGNVVIYNALGETVYQGDARHFNNQKPGAYLIKAGKDVKKVICK
ncbi:MAG: leucine-rich repeat protein [Bacteroidales bacterium]|nr:leucine-rich repeat protein [Bacteroidales bacterium]